MPDEFRNPVRAPGRLLFACEPRSALAFCVVLLTAASALASLVFACATPFSAFAVVAGAMLPLAPALAVVAAAWLVNQTIGFCLLGYSFDANTIVWGIAIGAAGLAATAVSAVIFRRLSWRG